MRQIIPILFKYKLTAHFIKKKVFVSVKQLLFLLPNKAFCLRGKLLKNK